MPGFRKIAAVAGLQLSLLAQSALGAPPNPDCNGPKLGAVASESAVCSRIGTDLLQAGGNAADAMVGTVFCVGVIGMYHSGIGGGGFALVRSSEGKYVRLLLLVKLAPVTKSKNLGIRRLQRDGPGSSI